MFESEFDRVGVDDFDTFDDAEKRRDKGVFIRIYCTLVVPAHHLGIEVAAFVEFDPLAQVKT